MMVFINRFTLRGDAAEFERAFATTSEFFRKQPGFLGHRLVRSLDDPAAYTNIAEWTDRASLQRALREPEFEQHAQALRALAGSTPGFFEPRLTVAAG